MLGVPPVKALLDANVLFPTVMRQVLLGVAARGLFTPQWSARILEEWARAAERLDREASGQARGEIALLQAAWPGAELRGYEHLEPRLWLPDLADIHVLAAAIKGGSDVIVTSNAKDFPRHILAEEGLSRADPDQMLRGFWEARPEPVAEAVEEVRAEAVRMSGEAWTTRALLKKARLPRLGKALEN